MNLHFAGIHFSGRNLAAQPVELTGDGQHLELHGLEEPRVIPLRFVRASDRLARLPRQLYLPDGETIQTDDNDAVDALLRFARPGRLSACVHWLEQRTRVAVASTVLLVLGVVLTLWLGLPVAVRHAARQVPEHIECQAGEVSLRTLDAWLAPSELPLGERARVSRQLQRMAAARGLTTQPTLQFRSMGRFPNAFALPGGTIVFSDALVHMATDDELAAVCAHEMAHWQLRHGLQSVLHGSAALLIVTTVTGDLSTLTTFASTIPFVLLQKGYSRAFEHEADDYAAETLRLAGMDTKPLAMILAKIEAVHEPGAQDFSYVSTHPATEDRIRKFDSSGEALRIARAKASQPAPIPESAPEISPVAAELSGSETRATPRVQYQPRPVYPAALRDLGIEGSVDLEFVVDANGAVREPRVVGSTHPGFEEEAKKAVMAWRFIPGYKHGRAVNTRTRISIHFSLTDEDILLAPESILRLPASATTVDPALPAPELMDLIAPVYPTYLHAVRATGEVVVEFGIDRTGAVRAPKVIRSTHPAFDEAALDAIRRWQYAPSVPADHRIVHVVQIKVVFNPDPEAALPDGAVRAAPPAAP